MFVRRLALAALWLCACAQGAAIANPSSESPDALLAVRPQPPSSELIVQAGVLIREATEAVTRYEQNLAEGRYKVGDSREMKNIGLTHNQVTQVDRVAQRLIALSEPAGADLRLRAAELHARLRSLIEQYRKLPNAAELVTKSVVQVENISKGRARMVPRLGEFFKQGKVDQAEKGINDIYDELEPLTVWHLTRVHTSAYAPFAGARGTIDVKARELRVAETQQLLEEMRTANDPGFDAVLAQVKAATDALGKEGKATWNGQPLDGPALVQAWGEAWRSVQTKTFRCRAIDWARGVKAGARPPSELDQLETAYLQFEEKMIAAVGALIAADAARAFPDAVPSLYAAYLDAVATLTPQIASDEWQPTVEAALAGLRDKAPLLAKQVATYEEATAEVLRWRKRAAASAAKARTKEARALDELWKSAATPVAMVDRKGGSAKPILTYLTTGAPPLVRDVDRVTLKKPASVAAVSPTADGAAVSRYRERLAARVSTARIPAEEIVQLRKELLVGPSDPPLTLAAAIAIKSAEQGYLQAAGGEIAGLHLESLLVHFMLLPDDAPHLALGPFPVDAPPQNPGEPVEQMTYWFEIAPRWLQHEYIFVELP